METDVFPHVWHYVSSKHFLKQAEEKTEGSLYPLLASMLFSAFCFEAYLNFLGREQIVDWESTERKLGLTDKLDLLSKSIKYNVDSGRRPFQTIKELFRFRDMVVHAKPETVTGERKRHKDTGQLRFPTSKWIELCDLATATRFHEDVKESILELHRRSGHGADDNPLLIPEISVFSIPAGQDSD